MAGKSIWLFASTSNSLNYEIIKTIIPSEITGKQDAKMLMPVKRVEFSYLKMIGASRQASQMVDPMAGMQNHRVTSHSAW